MKMIKSYSNNQYAISWRDIGSGNQVLKENKQNTCILEIECIYCWNTFKIKISNKNETRP